MKSVTLIALNAKYCHTCLAVRYLNSACKEKGIKAYIIELSVNESFREILKSILKSESDVYAFSCYLWNIELVKKLCIDLKALKPECEIILGGPEVSFDPEEYSFADVILCGEGEISLPEYLLGNLSQNIIFGKPLDNLDSLPFCYSDEDLSENKQRLIYYESSRGCPYSCSYCLSSVTKGVRFKSIEKVKDELRKFDNAKVDLVKFVDRTFNTDKKRALEIWKFAAEELKHTKCHFEIAGELLSDKEIEYLKTVPKGKFQFEIGIQSTNLKTLDAVNRKSDLNDLFGKIKKLLEAGNIHIHTDLIAGLPFETYEIFKKSFNEVYSLYSDCLQLGFLKLLKGSKIRNEAKKFSYRYSTSSPYEIYDNAFITASEIFRLEAIAETVERYYNSGAFKKSLKYIIQKYSSPFNFFEALSKEFDLKGAVAQKKLYEILHSFFEKNFGEDKLFTEYLKFDWAFKTKGVALPDYLGRQENLQPLFFKLLEEPSFKEKYFSKALATKNKEIVKHAFIREFYIPDKTIFLFFEDKVTDITKECEHFAF